MAPIRPETKASRPKPTKAKQQTSYPARAMDSAFRSTKEDKRLIKHSILMSKVHDAGVKKQKRRRPGKKLVANLESLEDALDHVTETEKRKDEEPGEKGFKGVRGEAKKREKVVKEERKRFGQNIAVMSQAAQTGTAEPKTAANRFAALRAHIQATTSQ